jgi:hypothetical protein
MPKATSSGMNQKNIGTFKKRFAGRENMFGWIVAKEIRVLGVIFRGRPGMP